MDFQAINKRLCVLRLRGKYRNYSIINAHSPTEEKDSAEKDTFYDALERAQESCPRHDIHIILGDFNAKVGQDENATPTIGMESLHKESNDNGLRLISFAESHNMIIGSTKFPHKDIHKQTWRSPDGGTMNQIDHVLIAKRHSSSLMDCRSYRGANMDSDHFLVITKIRTRLSTTYYDRNQNIKRLKKMNMQKLKTPVVVEQFKSKVKEGLTKINMEGESVDNTWRACREVLKESSEEILGSHNVKISNEWYDEECKIATENKNKAYTQMVHKHYTRRAVDIYRELRREEKSILKKKKRIFYEQQLNEMEKYNSQKESRKFYQLVNGLRQDFKPRIRSCRNKEGEILTGKRAVLDRWKEHFETLLNEGNEQDANISELRSKESETTAHEDTEEQPPTLLEVESAILKQRNNRSPGPDNIYTELLKQDIPELTERLHKVIQTVWTQEILPIDWTEGAIVPIHKKGDQLECANYRGITLLNTTYKVFSAILYNRMLSHVKKLLGNYQCGFRAGKSTTDQIHALRQVFEKTREYSISTYHLFIDFKIAYDSIKRHKLIQVMEEFNIPRKLINLTSMTLRSTKCQVKVQGDLSDPFNTKKGLRQGDGLACLLFNLALEWVIRKSGLDYRGTIYNRSIQLLAYADDLDIIARSTRTLKEAFIKLQRTAKDIGLQINQEKTKYMEVNIKHGKTPFFEVNECKFENVDQFKYLGTLITKDNNLHKELTHRIIMANRSYAGLKRQLKSHLLSTKTKIKLYRTLIRPILIYGSECWSLTKKEEEDLRVFERKVLRRIYGPTYDKGAWRVKYNNELYQLYGEPDIIKVVKAARLRWLGHLWRTEENYPCRKLTFNNPDGVRRRGRPPVRWLDSVESDLHSIGISAWRTKARDRNQWRKVVKAVMA